MPRIAFNKDFARTILREEGKKSTTGSSCDAWRLKIRHLSELCESGVSKTHIAFLGTAILAKALNASVNLYAIKPEHASADDHSFSARTLCHSVLVPMAAELGIHIGVTGREPLNNQPYFRMTRLGDGTPVHSGGRAAFEYMLELVAELHEMKTEAPAKEALRAYIQVRREYQPKYSVSEGSLAVPPHELSKLISRFVSDDSENGRRAQAVVAGLLDIFAPEGRVITGRINDPSRHYPGDVCIKGTEQDPWEKAFEVRDKSVTEDDVRIFVNQCILKEVRETAVVMVSDRQPNIDSSGLCKWANDLGIGLTLFKSWQGFVDQVLFWSKTSKPEAAAEAVRCIEERLIEIEVSTQGVLLWQKLVQEHTF